MDRKKIMPLIVMISVVLVIGLVGGVGTAQENTNKTDSEGVQLAPGESLDLVVDTVSSDVSESVDSAARERQLGEASNQSERARVLAQDLAQTERQSENISEEYKETVEKFKDGELSKKELIYEVSRLNSKATAVENSAENIRYASQFIPQDELGSNNITQERINNVSENVDIISNDVASNVRKMAITNSRSVNLTVQDGSMNVDVRDTESGQSVYNGYNKDADNRKGGVSNLNTTQALSVAENHLDVNRSQYDTKISKKGPHYDIKFVNNSSDTQRVKVNGFDGSVLTSEIISNEDNEEASEGQGNQDDRDNGGDGANNGEDRDNRDDRGNGADNRNDRSDQGNSDNRGKPSATTSEVLEIIESNSDINTSSYEVEVQQYGAKFTAKLSNDNETQIISVNVRSGKIIEQSIDSVEDDERATYNISEAEALNKVADEFDLNVSNYEVEIEKDDGNYEIELESENEEYEVLVDGNNGNILEYESDVDREETDSDDEREDEDEESDNEEREDNEEEDEDEESNIEEFEGEITSVDIQNNTITVNGDIIDVSNSTIENDSEVKTYSEAVQLLNNGTVVLAEGEGEIATEMNSVDYIANTIEIESEDEEEDEDMERNNTEENNSTDNDGQERNSVR